jgi:hypothetical protein
MRESDREKIKEWARKNERAKKKEQDSKGEQMRKWRRKI